MIAYHITFMDTKLIVVIIFGILFTVASIFSIVNASRLLGEGFKEIIGYEACDYDRPKVISPEGNITSENIYPEDFYCMNDRKRNVAESLAYLIISLPIAILFYRKLAKLKK